MGRLIHWGQGDWFVVSDILLYRISLCRVSTVLYKLLNTQWNLPPSVGLGLDGILFCVTVGHAGIVGVFRVRVHGPPRLHYLRVFVFHCIFLWYNCCLFIVHIYFYLLIVFVFLTYYVL